MTSDDDVRSPQDLAVMAVRVATAAGADAIVCATHDGTLPLRIRDANDDEGQPVRLIAASHDASTRADLEDQDIEVVAVSTQVLDRYRQARLATSAVMTSERVSEGELVVCVVGHGTALGGGDLLVVADLDETSAIRGVGDLVSLLEGVSRGALEATLAVAEQIALAAARGKRIGALFVLGDTDRVLEGAHQLVFNPLLGHEESHRRITDAAIHESLVELAKLDGAFVVRGDGLIRRAGVFLASGDHDVSVPSGLGARHTTAAAVTARTQSAAVVVSATDGAVRVFSNGDVVLHRHAEVSQHDEAPEPLA